MTRIPDDDRNQRRNEASERKVFPGITPEELRHINLYFGGSDSYPDLPTLWSRWLEELAETGLSTEWRKQNRLYAAEAGALENELRSVRLENGQTLWFVFYPWALMVLDGYRRADLATLGALAALEAGEIDANRVRKALSSADGSFDGALRELAGIRRGRESDALRFASRLLRYYRPEFDDLSGKEQGEYLAQVCERLEAICRAERKLAELLEFGEGIPGKMLRSGLKDAALDVELAEIYDTQECSYLKLGEEFGIPQTESDKRKGDNQAVRKKVKRGRELLNRALDGDGGWAPRRPGT